MRKNMRYRYGSYVLGICVVLFIMSILPVNPTMPMEYRVYTKACLLEMKYMSSGNNS